MPKRILLVEKDDFYVEVIGTFVKLFLQHQLEVVHDGISAFDRVRTDQPNLVLLDLESGPEALAFAERMRDDSSTKRVPILALSQHEDRKDDALGRGCAGFLAKPFRVRELESVIEHLLGGA